MTEDKSRERIVENLKDNVFVEAGAGAGKTTLIVSRIISQLKSGMLPSEIVVITFTNAAAEELRSRIIAKVREACNDKGLLETEREYLRNALQQLDLMNISTIHSFCLKLLRERIFDARLPMDAALMAEEETIGQHKAFFTEWVSKLDAADWNILYQSGGERWEIAGQMEAFFEEICELPDDVVIRYNRSAKDRTQEVKQLVERLKAELCQSWASISGNTMVEINDIPDEKLGAAGRLVKSKLLLSKVPYWEIVSELVKKPPTIFENRRAEGNDKEARVRENLRCKDWWEQNKPADTKKFLTEQEDFEYGLILQYAIKARTAYRAERSIQYLSNDDLLQKTHRLICESKEARDYFAGRIRCLYVDEFQDTDQIQEEFIWKLAAAKEDETQLRDGALFLVGDPKQSIYRFRGAEPEVYFKAKQKMEQLDNATVYCLDYNFRSNEKIIDWVNTNFTGRAITLKDAYRPMIARKGLPEQMDANTLAGVYYYREPEKKLIQKAEDMQALATLIKNLVHKPYRIVDYQDQVPYERPINFADFLILCRGKTDMDAYRKVMISAGIPVQIYGEVSLAENQILGNYARVYDYLTHRHDYAKKMGALEAMKASGDFHAEETLREIVEVTKQMSGYGVAEYLLHRLDVLLPKNKEIDREQMVSAQTKLQQMFERVMTDETTSGESLSEAFWKYMESKLEREISLEESGNAVRFMNLHKAKGLEGQIVVLTKRDEDISFHKGSLRKGKEYYPAYRSEHGNVLWSAYEGFSDILQEAQKQEDEEQTRLQYVAATRAKQALIVMDAVSKSKKASGPCMFTGFALKDAAGVNSVESIVQEEIEISLQEVDASAYAYTDHMEEVRKPTYVSSSPSALETVSHTRQSVLANMTEEKRQSYAPKERPTGNIAGNVIHRSLELLIKRWSFAFDKCPDDLRKIFTACAEQAILENRKDIEEKYVENYRSFSLKIQRCFAKWAYENELFRKAKEVHTEMTFSYYKENEKTPVWMNGTADLVIQRADGRVWILDYKSDYAPYLSEEEFEVSLKERYAEQLYEYRYAISRLFSVTEEQIDLGILSFDGDEDELTLQYTRFT